MDIPFGLVSSSNIEACQSPLTFSSINIIIIVCSVLGLLWAGFNFVMVRRVDIEQQIEDEGEEQASSDLTGEQKRVLLELSYKMSDASMQFVKLEYAFALAVLVAVFLLVWLLTEKGLTTAISLLVGGLVNMVSSLLALMIATQSNYRIAYCAKFETGAAFRTAYKASCAIAFGVASLSVLALIILIDIILQTSKLESTSSNLNYYRGLFEAVAGYALGTSLVSIFGRVSGGVFASGSEVGAELVGKMEGGMTYNSPRNPATVIGELLGGVVEYTSTLTETVCVVFILSCTSLTGFHSQTQPCNLFISNFMYPLMAVALGLFFSIVVSSIGTNFIWIEALQQGQSIVRFQVALTSFVILGFLYLGAYLTFPSNFVMNNIYQKYYDIQKPWIPYLCSVVGILSALLLCLFNEFLTSSSLFPIQSLVQSSQSSAAANIANGLALGYLSTIVPIIIISGAAYISNMLLGFYGIGLAVIGVLSGTPIFLAHHIFAPLADNSYNMAQLSELGDATIEKTEEMDQIGKAASARGRAFIIQPAALAGLALFGGYLFNINMHLLDSEDLISITQPLIFTGVLLGAMIPFLFSGIILPAVRGTASELVGNVSTQLRQDEAILQGASEPDYAGSSGVVVWSSIKATIFPILIALLSPLIIGFAFGVRVVAGYLIGLTVSGIQFALAGINSGQAWRKTRKMIESGGVADQQGKVIGRGTQSHKTSLKGEEVGNSLEHVASIPLSTIIKLSGIVSVVFASEMLSVRG